MFERTAVPALAARWLSSNRALAGLRGRIRMTASALGAAPGASAQSPPARALAFVRALELPTGGIRVHAKSQSGYPEVSGYLIPTLFACGERPLGRRLARWLSCIQRSNGGFPDPDAGVPHVFDSGQVLRGLLAAAPVEKVARESAHRAAEYLCSQLVDGGDGGFGRRYGDSVPETVHLYVLPALQQAADALGQPAYRLAVDKCVRFYRSDPRFLNVDELTHFLGYELEALIDLGLPELALPTLSVLESLQDEDGSIRGRGGVSWVCSPGLAQIAICWYKVGRWEPADRAMLWLESHQRRSGGFLGSYGRGAAYFPGLEPGWAAKFYLDAHRHRVLAYMDRHADRFPSAIEPGDGRAQAVLSLVPPGGRVAEVGCGKGRFLGLIRERSPGVECTGLDISRRLLGELPAGVRAVEAPMESIPCPDDSFDLVFSVEAIEHSINPQAAVDEMIRVARPGGWILIVDKQRSQTGRLVTPPWERWPEAGRLQALLNRGCDNTSVRQVGYDHAEARDGLMVAWQGQKRSPLTGSQWNDVLLGGATRRALVERVRGNRLTPWGQEIHLLTAPGEHVLEIGSGTGEISLSLAQSGRRVFVADVSTDSLQFSMECARELDVPLFPICLDATRTLPFQDDEVDCVWSFGLLEHHAKSERREMLREFARIARQRVVIAVPNAAAVAYRAGKEQREREGHWRYGLEDPVLTMRDDFAAAGLSTVAEYSVGARHGLNFLDGNGALRRGLERFMDGKSEDELRECHQGYLLFSVGRPTRDPA